MCAGSPPHRPRDQVGARRVDVVVPAARVARDTEETSSMLSRLQDRACIPHRRAARASVLAAALDTGGSPCGEGAEPRRRPQRLLPARRGRVLPREDGACGWEARSGEGAGL